MGQSEFRVYTGKELLETELGEEMYIIQNFLWEGDHVFLLGEAKAGKSILAMQMTCALTSGTAFLGKYEAPIPMKVMYVQAEGKRRDTIARLQAMCNEQGIEWNPNNFFLLYHHSVSLDTTQGYEDFIKYLDPIVNPGESIGVLVLDPLYMCMAGDLIDNLAARNMVRNVRKLSDRYRCTVVVVLHEKRPEKDSEGNIRPRKQSESVFGSFVWIAFPDHIISIEKNKNGLYRLSCDTDRTSHVIKDVAMKMVQPYPLYFELLGEDQKPYVSEVWNVLRDVDIEEGITKKELQERCDKSESAVEKSLAVLRKEGKTDRLNPGKRPVRYIPKEPRPIQVTGGRKTAPENRP